MMGEVDLSVSLNLDMDSSVLDNLRAFFKRMARNDSIDQL